MATKRKFDDYDLRQEVEVNLDPEGWTPGRVRMIGLKRILVATFRPDGRFYVEAEVTSRSKIRLRKKS